MFDINAKKQRNKQKKYNEIFLSPMHGGGGYRKKVFDTFDTEQKWLNECLVFRKEDSIKLDLIHIAKLDSNGTRFFYQKKEFLMPKYVPRSLPGVCKAIVMTTKMKIWDWCDDYLCFGKAGAEFEEGANMVPTCQQYPVGAQAY